MDANTDFGIGYRLNESSQYSFDNYTLTPDNGQHNGTMSFGPYQPGTTLDWYTLYYVKNDTLINQSRLITRVDVKETSFGDGNPVLEASLYSTDAKSLIRNEVIYTQNSTVQFNTTVSVPKGNLTEVILIPDTGESPINFPDINGTIEGKELSLFYNYSEIAQDLDFDEFNATIYATTDKGLNVSQNFFIVVDRIRPTGQLLIPGTNANSELVTEDGQVTFSFSFSDLESGVLRAQWRAANCRAISSPVTYRHRRDRPGPPPSDPAYRTSIRIVRSTGLVPGGCLRPAAAGRR